MFGMAWLFFLYGVFTFVFKDRLAEGFYWVFAAIFLGLMDIGLILRRKLDL